MTEQPDHLDIAVGLGFQAAAGAGTVQITVDVELQQISRRVARTTRRLRHRADKPKRREVQPVDKCLDEPHRIVSSDVIVNRLRQEEQLRTVVTGKVCHAGFYRTTKDVGIPHIEFSHSLLEVRTNPGPKGPQVTEIVSLDASTASQEPPRRPRPERPAYPSGDHATIEQLVLQLSLCT